MYAKVFFEHFWEGDQRNELFVCMPFHDSFDSKLKDVMDPGAKMAGFDKAERVKEDWEANVITDRVFDGIANSRMILFDLADDPKAPCQFSKQVNGNVLYELGIANAVREPEDIVLIRHGSADGVPFDIAGLNINVYDDHLSKEWLANKLRAALNDQKWYMSKRVKAAARAIDEIALTIMCQKGCFPDGYNHFNIVDKPPEWKIAVLRLVDLGILWFASAIHEKGYEHAYRWTPFGREVMKYLGIRLLSEDEFKNTPQYEVALKANEEFKTKLKDLEDVNSVEGI